MPFRERAKVNYLHISDVLSWTDKFDGDSLAAVILVNRAPLYLIPLGRRSLTQELPSKTLILDPVLMPHSIRAWRDQLVMTLRGAAQDKGLTDLDKYLETHDTHLAVGTLTKGMQPVLYPVTSYSSRLNIPRDDLQYKVTDRILGFLPTSRCAVL